MHPSQILHVRDRLATLDHAALRRQAPHLLRARTHEEVAALLGQLAG
jgi:phosphotransferase system enzyme I (PtsI)